MAETLTIRTASSTEVIKIAVQGPQGPAGAPGTGLETLTTQGDTLYRGASTGERLPIGTAGQVLKVVNGLPAWANESGAVSSVAGRTGAVTLASADISSEQVLEVSEAGDANCNGVFVYGGDYNGRPTYYKDKNTFVYWDNLWNISHNADDKYVGTNTSRPWQAVWSLGSATGNLPVVDQLNGQEYEKAVGQRTNPTAFGTASGKNVGTGANDVAAGNDARFSDSRTPTAHAASHASAGNDPVFDQDLGTEDDVDFNTVTVGNEAELTFNQLKWSGQPVLNLEEKLFYDGLGGGAENIVWGLGNGIVEFNRPIDFIGENAATNAATTRTNLGLGDAATADIGTGSTEVAAGDHGHGNITSDGKLGSTAGLPVVTTTAGAVTTLALGTANQVLRVNSGASGVEFADPAASGIGGSTGSTDNLILRSDGSGGAQLQNSALQLDDATTSTQANVAIVNAHSETNSALVLTPKGNGAFIVGQKPDGTASGGGNARGANAIDIQTLRFAAAQVASGSSAVAIGVNSTSSATNTIAIGNFARALANNAVGIGGSSNAATTDSVCVGNSAAVASASVSGVAIGNTVTANVRSEFATRPFSAAYWGGQTTNNTATVLNLDATATNRFTIAANTALAVDILLVARRSDTADKWLVARRFLGIRRDGSNNTSLIGTVQTLGADQSAGSPTWTFSLTADDTNEALQLEVTGATSETVQWRATAFYRVV